MMRFALSIAAMGTVHAGCTQTVASNAVGIQIQVDRFGYRVASTKTAVLEVDGSWDRRFDVRDVETHEVVHTGRASRFDRGSTVWQLDLTDLAEPGTYRVETQVGASDDFEVRDDVYAGLLAASLRTFTHRRGSGGGGWQIDGSPTRTVVAARGPVHQLLTSYEDRPHAWSDAMGLPESGNGIPDVLDEVRVELEWVLSLQDEHGGVISSVEADGHPGLVCSSSTMAATGLFAHAASAFEDVDVLFSEELRDAARAAWDWTLFHPWSSDCGLSLREQHAERMVAAAYLDPAEPDESYASAIVANVHEAGFVDHPAWGIHTPHVSDSLRSWMQQPASDLTVVSVLEELFDEQRTASSHLFGRDEHDPYGASVPASVDVPLFRANVAHMNLDVVRLGLAPRHHQSFVDRAASALHYLHGTNPRGHVHLWSMRGVRSEPTGDPQASRAVESEGGTGSTEITVGDASLSLVTQATYVKLLAEFVGSTDAPGR